MRRSLAICVLLLLPLAMVLADTAQSLAQVDVLHDQGQYAEAKQRFSMRSRTPRAGKEKAELYWRAARETLELGDQAEEAKQPAAAILKFFEEGEGYANKAIEADPQNDLGYYWKSSNIGRWGQIKGILNSLVKAGSDEGASREGRRPEQRQVGRLLRAGPAVPRAARVAPVVRQLGRGGLARQARPWTCASSPGRGRARRRPSSTATPSSWPSPCTRATGPRGRARLRQGEEGREVRCGRRSPGKGDGVRGEPHAGGRL